MFFWFGKLSKCLETSRHKFHILKMVNSYPTSYHADAQYKYETQDKSCSIYILSSYLGHSF